MLKAIIPKLDTKRSNGKYLPYVSKDLGNGFVFLWAHKSELRSLYDYKANALYLYLSLFLGPKVLVQH